MKRLYRYAVTLVAALALLSGCANTPATSPAATQTAPAARTATQAPATATTALPTAAPETAAPTVAIPATDAPAASPAAATPGSLALGSENATPANASPAGEAGVEPEATATIACTPGQLTPAQTEGPYYTANPPQASSLLQPGMSGTKLTITGYVLDAQCRPVPGARVDFWQADSEGQYDNQGYTLRGYQVADAEGRYTVETVTPGLYPGRTRHIHVKVTAPGGPTLTTQLYFPGETANASDRIFSSELVLPVEKSGDGEGATFNFVIDTK